MLAKIEAILFTYGEGIAVKDLAKRLKLSPAECQNWLDQYQTKLAGDPERGLAVLQNNGKVQLATKPGLQELIADFFKEEFRESLTPAALETLAIVAYLGPVPRSTIDQIRGVNSSFILRSLLVRGLVERLTDGQRSNLYLYAISNDSLRHLGLTSREELPEFQNYHDILTRFAVEESPN